MPRKTELEKASAAYDQERKWVEQCGGSLAGYVLRYGAASDPNHSGDGGEAIYAADKAALDRAEQRYWRALERASRKATR